MAESSRRSLPPRSIPTRPIMFTHPTKSVTSALIPAFRLVYEILRNEPLRFPDIVKRGIAHHQPQTMADDPSLTASSSTSAAAAEVVVKKRNPKSKKVDIFGGLFDTEKMKKEEAKAVETVKPDISALPDGHPFVSASFLKHRVLRLLETQKLVQKKVEVTSIHVPGKTKPTIVHTYKWSMVPFEGMEEVLDGVRRDQADRDTSPSITETVLDSPIVKAVTDTLHLTSSPSSTPDPTHSTAIKTSLPTWSLASHWSRLLSGEHPMHTHHDLTTHLSQVSSIRKENAYLSGKLERPEREMWLWKDREPELTTRLERLHLNVRRRNARDGKEQSRLRKRKAFEEVKRVLRVEEDEVRGQVLEELKREREGKDVNLIGN